MSATLSALRLALLAPDDGDAVLREGDPADAIDGVVPHCCIEPVTANGVAKVLAWAAREGITTVLRGGGTKLDWGRRPQPVDLIVSMRQLNHVLAHADGDLTATVEAGTTVRALNLELAKYRQCLPVDTAFDESTVGGLIATNESGPLRHRHGTPRDLLIGIHLAMTDGRVVKAGGTVVKNVAGYDLGRLVSGSHGSLAAIVSATFKLAPLPGTSATVVAGFADRDRFAHAVTAISASQLEPAAFDLHVVAGTGRIGPGGQRAAGATAPVRLDPQERSHLPYRVLVQFASTQAATDAQVDAVQRLISADAVEVITGPAEGDLWRGQSRDIWSGAGAIVRASWLPANLQALLSLLHELTSEADQSIELVGRAGVGAGLIRLDRDPSACVAAIARLRAQAAVLGHVVVLRADPEVKRQLDVWGAPGDHQALLASVKRAFDPAGILNAGRGPL